MSDTRAWAEALYDKMSEYSMSAQGDHREHCIVEVLIPWIKADGKRIASLQQDISSRDDQAAIDKDFIRQYQEQVEELQAELKQANEAIDKMMAVEKARVKAGGEPWAQPQESDL